MAAIAPLPQQQALPVQQANGPSPLDGLIQKISAIVMTRWTLVVASALLAGACFGVLVGLGVAAVSALVAAFVPKKAENAVPAPVGGGIVPIANPAPLIPVAGVVGTREYLAAIFQQTLGIIREGLRINADMHRQMVAGAVIVPADNRRGIEPPVRPVETRLMIEQATTFAMTRRLVEMGHRPLVLDMANRYTKGGGVLVGAAAQEETICRQSDLYSGLEPLAFPLPEMGGAFVPGVQFFRDDAYNPVHPFVADVFVSAAYNCNERHRAGPHGPGYDRPEMDMFYEVNTDAKIRTMLNFAIDHGHRALVLSAFGCGAFRNDPTLIANAYRRILHEPRFEGAFDVVAFGIYDPPGAAYPNYPIFRDILVRA